MKEKLTALVILAALFVARAYMAWMIAESALPPWFKFWLLR